MNELHGKWDLDQSAILNRKRRRRHERPHRMAKQLLRICNAETHRNAKRAFSVGMQMHLQEDILLSNNSKPEILRLLIDRLGAAEQRAYYTAHIGSEWIIYGYPYERIR